jgi:hypothetical protein
MLIRRTLPARRLVAKLSPPGPARGQQPYTPRQDDNGRRLVGTTPVAMIPRRHLTHELTVTNVSFFRNTKEKTLVQPSSGEEKRIVSPTSA